MSTPTHHQWAVTGQTEKPLLDEEGNPTTEHTVNFRTAGGHESQVTLLDRHFSAQNVHAAITHKARELMKVHEMTSETHPAEPGKD